MTLWYRTKTKKKAGKGRLHLKQKGERGYSMASRPKHVASLSDKIAGLKFMQRAKAVQDQHQQAGPSSTTSTATQVSMAPRNEVVQKYSAEPEDINEEHWSLPVSRHSTIKQSTSSTSVITHEPGWNAWLNEAEDSQPSASTAAPRLSSRRSFGTWTKKRKSKEPSTSDTKRSQTPLSDEESLKDSSDDDSDASEEVGS